ncbi:MAG TPA: DUF3352 domain-containing protein [Blastocatellia bacterium]|nr:DUF3352 domain-containing protein [Blastocatellia bacterium]
MRIRTCAVLLPISLTLSMLGGVKAQSFNTNTRRATTGDAQEAQIVASARPGEASTQSLEGASLESLVPRDGLQLYVEIRNAGLTELVKSPYTIQSFAKLLSSGPVKTTTSDLASFVMGNLGVLSNARVALAGYNAGQLVLIEAGSAADAEQLQRGVATLLGRSQKNKKSGAAVEAMQLGRAVLVGPREFTGRLAQVTDAVALAGDPEFMKARGRFEPEQFFAYIDLGSMSRSLPQAAMTPGAMAALSGMPTAVALGGSIAGDAATVRALMVNGSSQTAGPFPGLFSSLASATQPGQPVAGTFASADSDLFVDVMLDWDKLYEAIESMLKMFVSSFGYSGTANGEALPPPAQSAGILGMLETSLGFSIRHDLIPTLGGELAISMSGLRSLRPKQAAQGMTRPASPNFMFMVALKDAAGFEKLIGGLMNRSKTSAAQFTRAAYRGVMINASKSFAWTIVNGFFVAGGSAAQIRRAVDAQATGVSLASTEAFKSAFPSSQQAALQAYVSPALVNELFESLSKGAPESNVSLASPNPIQARMPVVIQAIPDEEGLMIEARLPTNLALLALASMAGGSSPRSATAPKPAGIGISEPGPRVSGSPRTPRMTTEDFRRRP